MTDEELDDEWKRLNDKKKSKEGLSPDEEDRRKEIKKERLKIRKMPKMPGTSKIPSLSNNLFKKAKKNIQDWKKIFNPLSWMSDALNLLSDLMSFNSGLDIPGMLLGSPTIDPGDMLDGVENATDYFESTTQNGPSPMGATTGTFDPHSWANEH